MLRLDEVQGYVEATGLSRASTGRCTSARPPGRRVPSALRVQLRDGDERARRPGGPPAPVRRGDQDQAAGALPLRLSSRASRCRAALLASVHSWLAPTEGVAISGAAANASRGSPPWQFHGPYFAVSHYASPLAKRPASCRASFPEPAARVAGQKKMPDKDGRRATPRDPTWVPCGRQKQTRPQRKGFMSMSIQKAAYKIHKQELGQIASERQRCMTSSTLDQMRRCGIPAREPGVDSRPSPS